MISSLIRRPVAVSMLMLIIAVTGIYSSFKIPIALTPEVELPQVSVLTSWPNASPEMVEAFITAPIEGVCASLPGVRYIESNSSAAESRITLKFTAGTAIDFATLRLSEQLGLVKEKLPHNASLPRIEKYVPEEFRQEVFLSYQVSGPYSLYRVREIALQNLRTPLQAIRGVAEVQVRGGQEAEIHILLHREVMKLLRISIAQVHRKLATLNLHSQGGSVAHGNRDIELVVTNPLASIAALKKLQFTTGSAIVTLQDFAEIRPSFTNVQQLVRIDGNPAVSLEILREPGQNAIALADAVFDRLAQLANTLPAGIKLLKNQDESARIRRDMRALGGRSIFSLIVILFVLMVFYRHFRLPFLVMTTIAFSVLLTINLLYFSGITLNIITLAGLALGFGMLVDNAIVVIENIHRLRENGLVAEAAAARGTREIISPLLAATLTTIVVLVPFYFLEGEIRVYYLPFALAVMLSLLASLLMAFLFTPTFAARVAPAGATRGRRLSNGYAAMLVHCIRWPWLVLFFTALLAVFSLYQFRENVTIGNMWNWGDATYLYCYARLPKGAQLQRADDIARSFEEKVVGLAGVKRVKTTVTAGLMRVRIDFDQKTAASAYPLIIKDQLSVHASHFAGVSIGVAGFGPGYQSGMGGSIANFRIKVLGYGYQEVKRIAEVVGRKLSRNVRVREVNTAGSGKWWGSSNQTETVLNLKREALSRYGFAVSEVFDQLGAYLRENQQRRQITLDKQKLAYRVKFADFEKFDLRDLQQLTIFSPNNSDVRLADIAEIKEVPVQSEIMRENQQYQRWITFEYRGPYRFGKKVVERVVANTPLPPGYSLEIPTWDFSEKDQRQIIIIGLLAVLLVFMVTAALYESLIQPLLIMFSVPLALIGVCLIYWLSETNFDRSALIGVVLLSGIVVNNAILMVDRISLLKNAGKPISQAIVEGASQRLRPIIMTTATTIFGLVPLVIAGGKTQLWGTLALSTIGGLGSSAFLILFVVPALYKILIRK